MAPPPVQEALLRTGRPTLMCPREEYREGGGRLTWTPPPPAGPEWTASSPPHSLPSSWASFQTSSRVHSSSKNSLTLQQEMLLPSPSFWTFPAPLSPIHLLGPPVTMQVLPPAGGRPTFTPQGPPPSQSLGPTMYYLDQEDADKCPCTFQKKLFRSPSETILFQTILYNQNISGAESEGGIFLEKYLLKPDSVLDL